MTRGRPLDINRVAEIRRLYAAGWPVVSIAHQLNCGETLVHYHLGEKNGTKAKVGSKVGSTYVKKAGENLAEEQIDEIYGAVKYENQGGKEWL